MFCSTKIKGTHHLQGNVQVYNVRIPENTVRKEGEWVEFSGQIQPVLWKQTASSATGERAHVQAGVGAETGRPGVAQGGVA